MPTELAEIEQLQLHFKQSVTLMTRATEVLFGGAAGGGKSFLLRVAAIAWASSIPGLQVYLFRRTSPDLIKNHMEGRRGFPVLLNEYIKQKRARINYGDNEIIFENGSKIYLCHCQYEKDMYKYQGAEMDVLLIDELTHFTATIYRFLRSRVRSVGLDLPDELKGKFGRILAGSNPGGIGHNWVKAMFIDGTRPFQLRKMGKRDGGMLRQYVPATLEDNPSLTTDDPEYEDRLTGLGSDSLVRAMRYGDWNIVAGGMFDDLWDDEFHVVEPFKIPSSWRIDRTFDWGSSHPFAVSWWAESDGTRFITPDKRVICYPRGTVIKIAEWYGWNGTPNEGCKKLAVDIAKGIKEREDIMRKEYGYVINPGPADSSIFDSQNGNCIADDMTPIGIRWTAADKSPGSRRAGAERVRKMLKETSKERPEDPCLVFFSTCVHSIRCTPTLPRDPKNPDDVNSASEDHDYDTIRYRVQSALKTIKVGDLTGH